MDPSGRRIGGLLGQRMTVKERTTFAQSPGASTNSLPISQSSASQFARSVENRMAFVRSFFSTDRFTFLFCRTYSLE